MQFQVPQFIEVEDKIFGPLTFKQFIYIGGGLGSCYLFYRFLPIYLAAPLIAVFGGLAAGLAFFQFNGRPFIIALETGFFFLVHRKLYLWNAEKRTKTMTKEKKDERVAANVFIPKLSESRLHELAWSLDIKERIAAGTADDIERQSTQRQQVDVLSPIRTSAEARRTDNDRIGAIIEKRLASRANLSRA